MKTKLNADLYEFFSRNVPKLQGESDQSWKERIKNNPALVEQQIRKAPFAEQLKLVAMRRALAVAGGKRSAGIAGPNNTGNVAAAYEKDFISNEASRKKFAGDMVNFLDNAFEYGSPADGSIFWTGVDPNKLVKQVGIWNAEFKDEMFGQLEATTDARYINGAFDWEVRGAAVQATQMYFGQVSERYGAMAKGHVTSVQMWGLRNDSIFTTKELPTLLKHMNEALTKGKTPAVQDITIVVLDPLGTNDNFKCFTNLEIGQIPIVYKHVPDAESRWIRGRQDCAVQSYVNSMVPPRVKALWFERGKRIPSRAAVKITNDYNSIKR